MEELDTEELRAVAGGAYDFITGDNQGIGDILATKKRQGGTFAV